MKTDTKIICDYCGEEVSVAKEESVGSNPHRGWITIHDNDIEKNFCSPICKHRDKYDTEHPDEPHKNSIPRFRISRLLRWPNVSRT
jgi:hypothetical protein